MTERSITDFLAGSGWEDWQRTPLAGDASRRRYERLVKNGRSVILMDADPELGEDVRPFLRIGRHLDALGLCPPAILRQDDTRGYLLLEDLGPSHFAQWLADHPQEETSLYSGAIEVISCIHAAMPPDGLSSMDAATGADMTGLFAEWFAPQIDAVRLHDTMLASLQSLEPYPMRLSLRDFHAENLIWRPDRAGTDRIGLLDFQDAFLAHPAYDPVSLLRDVRRDVSEDTISTCKDRFAAMSALPDFDRAFAVIAAQRNLRIAGIFARLIRRDGKDRYAAFLPRVIGHLRRDLRDPALADLAKLVLPELPA